MYREEMKAGSVAAAALHDNDDDEVFSFRAGLCHAWLRKYTI